MSCVPLLTISTHLQIKEPRASFYFKSSELFENEVYLEEVSDVLCIVQAGKCYKPERSQCVHLTIQFPCLRKVMLTTLNL